MEENRHGRRIRAFRKLKRVQQAELAKRIGISTTALGRIERGEKDPSHDMLHKIADELIIDIQDIMRD